MDVKKIVILGISGSGKTTAMRHICNDMIQTTALDYGNTVFKGKKTHFFSPPGHKRFKFMQDVLSKNISGSIIFVDSSKGIKEIDLEIIEFIKEKRVPYVIFANKQDISNRNLNTDSIDAHVIPTIATTGEGIDKGLKILLKLIDENKTQIAKLYPSTI